MSDNYDVIVIGSGISGLTVANLLGQTAGKRVLVLEQHYQAGGYTHVFSRKGYTWDVGLHYVGRMFGGALPRVLFDYMSKGKVKWNRINDPFEKLVYPDFTFEVFSGRKRFRSDIELMFPAERRAIRKYFSDVRHVSNWFVRFLLSELLWPPLRKAFRIVNWYTRSFVRITTSRYLETRISDPKLRAVLVSQWGNYGLPPSESSFVIHCVVANHFVEGGYYPAGGSGMIAAALTGTIKERKGDILTGHTAEEIIIERGRAKGVRVKTMSGEEKTFFADTVVSSVGAYNTFLKLVPQQVPICFREKLQDLPAGTCTVSLYLGLKKNPSSMGFRGENYWICQSYDHDWHFDDLGVLDGRPTSCYLSFPSLKDPLCEKHTAVIITYVDYNSFRRWSKDKPGRREDDYYQFKKVISGGLIDFVEKKYPGFSSLVDYAELATPLSAEHYTRHFEGAMYGLSAGPKRYNQNWLSVRTPIKGLFMTGVDVASLGVIGSMMGGLITAAVLSGPLGIIRIVAKARKYARLLRAR
jgi:phytoene dehydrogenase-like protein